MGCDLGVSRRRRRFQYQQALTMLPPSTLRPVAVLEMKSPTQRDGRLSLIQLLHEMACYSFQLGLIYCECFLKVFYLFEEVIWHVRH